MPALLLPLLLTAAAPAPETVELRGVTIREWGAKPGVASGVLWTVRKLVVVTASGDTRTLYRTHFSADEDTPPAGSRCDLRYRHEAGISALPGDGGVIREGDLVSKMRCQASPPGE